MPRAKQRDVNWQPVGNLQARTYRCGYCDQVVGPDKGWFDNTDPTRRRAYVCSYCGNPTLFYGNLGTDQTPGVAYGGDVQGLAPDVETLYREARDCTSQGAFTSAVRPRGT